MRRHSPTPDRPDDLRQAADQLCVFVGMMMEVSALAVIPAADARQLLRKIAELQAVSSTCRRRVARCRAPRPQRLMRRMGGANDASAPLIILVMAPRRHRRPRCPAWDRPARRPVKDLEDLCNDGIGSTSQFRCLLNRAGSCRALQQSESSISACRR
ncbi:hypothetical protein AB5I41_10210 [Sphingomonas sp. MMS24-JH45]